MFKLEELYIFDSNLNLVGEISTFESLEIERNYYTTSKLTLRVGKNNLNVRNLINGNIIALKSDLSYGYIIQHFSLIKEESDIVEVFALSLNSLLGRRTIPTQSRFTGDLTRVIENFVNYNAIQTVTSRVIPNLFISNNTLSNINVDSSATGGVLSEHIQSLAQEFEIGIEILMDVINKNLRLVVYKGPDYSINQTANNPIIFSLDFDNILEQTYFDSVLDYKNIAIVAGEGEGINRVIVEAGNAPEGIERREVYVDARDLQSVYQDENGTDITIPDNEYRQLLIQRGLEALQEYNRVQNFQATVNGVQYNYDVGFLVTFMDRELGIQDNVRITSISTKIDRNGKEVKPTFGNGIIRKR